MLVEILGKYFMIFIEEIPFKLNFNFKNTLNDDDNNKHYENSTERLI